MWNTACAVFGFSLVLTFARVVSAVEVESPTGRLLVFLPEGVDWIALPVVGHDLAAARAEFAGQVFESRDLDHNGLLDQNEAQQLLIWSSEQSSLRLLGDAWKSADTAPQDGQLTPVEWQALAEQAFGPELRITVDNQGTRRAGILFALVDQDHDGRLTTAELDQGSARLLRCDFDDDELITLNELAELRSTQAESTAATTLQTEPFLLLNSEEAIRVGIIEIESRFRPSASAGVPLDRIAGIDSTADQNLDGLLDSSELGQILKSPPTTGQLRITLKENKGGVRWFGIGSDSDSPATRRSDPVQLQGLAFDAKFLNTSLLLQLQKQELMTQFGGADRDNNEYLSPKEFAEFVTVLDKELAPDPALADVDGNDQITREEVTRFNDLRELASHCLIQLTVQRELKSLFDALDQDHNKGVSGWELLSNSEQMVALDQNRDGSVSATELTGELSLSVGFASPRREESAMTKVRQRTKSVPQKSLTQGPVWFQRMDRNQDHRVSWREFLGTREQFQSLDQNQDGSIAESEAQP